MKRERLNELLYEALETEAAGAKVYEAALRAALNVDLKAEWQKDLAQTREHEQVLLEVFQRIGLDPVVDTPGRLVVRQIGQALVQAVETAIAAGDGEAAQVVAAECVVLVETKDHQTWELIGIAQEALVRTSPDAAEALDDAYDSVEDEKDEHLYQTLGWVRELWLQTMGLPAQLPPKEEEKDVKSAAAAAKVRAARKKELRRQL